MVSAPTHKLAVAIIHGVGSQSPSFADKFIARLRGRFVASVPRERRKGLPKEELAEELVAAPVYWAPVLMEKERELISRTGHSHPLDWRRLRQLLVDLAGDGIAYQPMPEEQGVYNAIHRVCANALSELAQEAGDTAPLTIIAHSLGTVIAANFLWDLQHGRAPDNINGDSPVEKGTPFTNFYTMGSPLAMWALRYPGFGEPVTVSHPSQDQLKGEWINFFDDDDIVAYPLRGLNEKYAAQVSEDRAVSVGSWFLGWTPFSHSGYWTSNRVIKPIADKLAHDWMALSS